MQDAKALAEGAEGAPGQRPPPGLLERLRRCAQLLSARLSLSGAPLAPVTPSPAAPWAAAAADADASPHPGTDPGPDPASAVPAAARGGPAGPVAVTSGGTASTWDPGGGDEQQAGAGAADSAAASASGGDRGNGLPGVAAPRGAGPAAEQAEVAAAWGALAGDLDTLAGRPTREQLTMAVRGLLEAGDAVRPPSACGLPLVACTSPMVWQPTNLGHPARLRCAWPSGFTGRFATRVARPSPDIA